MKIQPVSAVSRIAPASGNSSQSSLLDRQIADLQKQISDVKESKQDAQSKAKAIQDLEGKIAELQKQRNQELLNERKKELEETQQKMAEKLEREAREKQEPDQALFTLQAQNMMKAVTQHSDLQAAQQVKAAMPDQETRDAFALKTAAKAFGQQKELSKSAVEQARLAREAEQARLEQIQESADSEDDPDSRTDSVDFRI